MLPKEFQFTAEQIGEANQFIEDLINAVPMSLNFWSLKSQYSVLANEAAMGVFNVASPEEFNELFLELSPEIQPDGIATAVKAEQNVKTAFEKGFVHFEWMHQTKDKELIPAEVVLVRIDRGDEVFVAGFVRDLRELNQTIAMLKNMEELAFTDELTGIFNRRHFMKLAQELLIETKKSKNKFFIVMFDGDHFKNINDTYGHQAGDYVLKELAALLRHAMRAHDVVGRYGGEEFIIAMNCAETDNAVFVAERVRRMVEEHRFVFEGQTIPVTISLGMAEAHPYDLQLDKIIANADKALYTAKKNGRNRVERFENNGEG